MRLPCVAARQFRLAGQPRLGYVWVQLPEGHADADRVGVQLWRLPSMRTSSHARGTNTHKQPFRKDWYLMIHNVVKFLPQNLSILGLGM